MISLILRRVLSAINLLDSLSKVHLSVDWSH